MAGASAARRARPPAAAHQLSAADGCRVPVPRANAVPGQQPADAGARGREQSNHLAARGHPRPAAAQRARSDPHAATRPALTHLVPTWSVGTRKMPQIPFAFWFSVIRISFVLRVSDFELLR